MLEKLRQLNLPRARFARMIADPEKCDGCGRCVQACPIQLLELHEGRPRSNMRYDAFRCITCQNCVAVCPNNAVTVEGDYRVGEGFWKNTHLYPGEKTPPAPLADRAGEPWEAFEGELTETERVIYQRRSVRLFRKKGVDRALVQRVIEAGRFAPSAGNGQPWAFVVVQGRPAVGALNERCKKALKAAGFLTLPHPWLEKRTPGEPAARLKAWQHAILPLLTALKTGEVEPRARGGINAASSDPKYDIFFGAPCVILLLVDRRGVGDPVLDLGMCGQNMVLAAHSLGLGTCYVSLVKAVNFQADLKKKLGIRRPFKLVTSIALGWPRGTVDRPVAREQPRVGWVDRL